MTMPFSPFVRFSRASYEGTILEHAPPLTEVITLAALDTDSGSYGKLTYQIIGDEQSDLFGINEHGQ